MLFRNLATVFFLSIAATAAVADPAAEPGADRVVAKLETHAYMIRRGARTTTVEITSQGKIRVTRVSTTGQTETKSVATLATSVLTVLLADIKSVTEADLIDTDPSQPACQDSPMTIYTVIKNGAEIDIAKRINCKLMRTAADTLEEEAIQSALDGARALADLNK